MRFTRTNIFIVISSVALLIVLIIQINWIFQTAKSKEELFNEKANIVLARTTEALLHDKETCKNIEACIGKKETHKIDSLFKYYMNFYNFHIDYSFQIVKPVTFLQKTEIGSINNVYPNEPGCYKKSLDEVSNKNRWELKLIFPEKKQFIIAEMKTMFIASLVLILIVLVLFWKTVVSLINEKRISEQTSDFFNNMTHEFKTPLTNIALAGRMIVKESAAKQYDKTKHYSGIILAENEKLRLQVEQVLSMTALERGEIPLMKT